MNVLFKNIPIGMTAAEFAEFITNLFNAGKNERLGLMICPGSVSMLEKQDNFSHPIEQFSVVRISPPRLATQVIEELDGCLLGKLQIAVREFFDRSTDNDPRQQNRETPEVVINKRVADRRTKTLVYSRHI